MSILDTSFIKQYRYDIPIKIKDYESYKCFLEIDVKFMLNAKLLSHLTCNDGKDRETFLMYQLKHNNDIYYILIEIIQGTCDTSLEENGFYKKDYNKIINEAFDRMYVSTDKKDVLEYYEKRANIYQAFDHIRNKLCFNSYTISAIASI
jgi:hypothetical protein